MAAPIFISYSRQDHDKAWTLAGRLKMGHFEVFIDESSISAGTKWRDTIEAALRSSSAIVVIHTSSSAASREVLFEIAYSMGLGKRIVPLLYDSTELPSFLIGVQALDFRSVTQWDQLIAHLKTPIDRRDQIAAECLQAGIIRIGTGRSDRERSDHIYEVLETAQNGSTITVVGRSLIDWAVLWSQIHNTISQRGVHVRLGLIDERTISRNNADGGVIKSWIEPPVAGDWAIADVPGTMERLRKITVPKRTGSLSVFGLPFYPAHSFVSYTKAADGKRYCVDEVGMSLPKGRRPFLEFAVPSGGESFASILESLNEGFLTEDRLLLFDDGDRRVDQCHLPRRGMLIADKVDKVGLVDIGIGYGQLDWTSKSITELIDNTPRNGELFIVARSVVSWTTHWQHLAQSIIRNGTRCTFCLAARDVKSLVDGDFAELDVPKCWEIFEKLLVPYLQANWSRDSGEFKAYALPSYVPATFAAYTSSTQDRFCTLEVGIGVGPESRPVMCFRRISGSDIYTKLHEIHRSMLRNRVPSLSVPSAQ